MRVARRAGTQTASSETTINRIGTLYEHQRVSRLHAEKEALDQLRQSERGCDTDDDAVRSLKAESRRR
jgi:hypothetical protein